MRIQNLHIHLKIKNLNEVPNWERNLEKKIFIFRNLLSSQIDFLLESCMLVIFKLLFFITLFKSLNRTVAIVFYWKYSNWFTAKTIIISTFFCIIIAIAQNIEHLNRSCSIVFVPERLFSLYKTPFCGTPALIRANYLSQSVLIALSLFLNGVAFGYLWLNRKSSRKFLILTNRQG